MSVELRTSPEAKEDILLAEIYFENCRIGLGQEFVREVLFTFDHIADFPLSFCEVATGVRAVGLRKFGYVVYYVIHAQSAIIMAVLHGSRNPRTWQARLE